MYKPEDQAPYKGPLLLQHLPGLVCHNSPENIVNEQFQF